MVTKNDDYTRKLEGVIKQMLKPLKNLPLSIVIEALSGYKIKPFDKDNADDKILLKELGNIVAMAGAKINKTGIKRSRPNEVGNDIETFLKIVLIKNGFKTDSPKTKDGRGKSTGYPDLCFYDQKGRLNYLECKIFNIESLDTTLRSFYLSPSENFKITQDAHHFAVSYEIIVSRRVAGNNIYKCKSWKILTLENLDVDVKYEFNSDNKRLYSESMILAEGKLNNL